MSVSEKSPSILLNFVLDKSGSMSALQASTIQGFNAFLAEQRLGEGEVSLSLTLFDSAFEVRFVAQDLKSVPLLGSKENRYSPSGGTALYDAVRVTITGVEAWLVAHPEFDGDVVTVIQTDGEENSSHTTSLDEVNALISEKTREGWEFVFLGTGKAAWTEGSKFTAIPAESRFAGGDSHLENAATYAGVSRGMTNKRTTGSSYTDGLRAESMPDQS